MSVSFAVSPADSEIIRQIVDRAQTNARRAGARFDRLGTWMDLTAVHANGCPLRLADLLNADDFDFNHDVFGVIRHLDRNTGQLRDCFLPRTAEL